MTKVAVQTVWVGPASLWGGEIFITVAVRGVAYLLKKRV